MFFLFPETFFFFGSSVPSIIDETLKITFLVKRDVFVSYSFVFRRKRARHGVLYASAKFLEVFRPIEGDQLLWMHQFVE